MASLRPFARVYEVLAPVLVALLAELAACSPAPATSDGPDAAAPADLLVSRDQGPAPDEQGPYDGTEALLPNAIGVRAPAELASAVPLDQTLTFDVQLARGVSQADAAASIDLHAAGGSSLPGTTAFTPSGNDPNGYELVFTPSAALQPNTRYFVRIRPTGGFTGVAVGHAPTADGGTEWPFTTEGAPSVVAARLVSKDGGKHFVYLALDFSERMVGSSLQPALTVSENGAAVSGMDSLIANNPGALDMQWMFAAPIDGAGSVTVKLDASARSAVSNAPLAPDYWDASGGVGTFLVTLSRASPKCEDADCWQWVPQTMGQ